MLVAGAYRASRCGPHCRQTVPVSTAPRIPSRWQHPPVWQSRNRCCSWRARCPESRARAGREIRPRTRRRARRRAGVHPRGGPPPHRLRRPVRRRGARCPTPTRSAPDDSPTERRGWAVAAAEPDLAMAPPRWRQSGQYALRHAWTQSPQLCGVARNWWISETTTDPSPTADATRLTEPDRTSPTAYSPGTLVS